MSRLSSRFLLLCHLNYDRTEVSRESKSQSRLFLESRGIRNFNMTFASFYYLFVLTFMPSCAGIQKNMNETCISLFFSFGISKQALPSFGYFAVKIQTHFSSVLVWLLRPELFADSYEPPAVPLHLQLSLCSISMNAFNTAEK